ncbi:hypothetical protein B0H12DRAFT_565478 [Mycena haematopus]|nr:hypothetical protein B0H12DRAFT_787583 [Mycena haematopus]KAJ7199565.1 hypothetical protein B0H12DRAFT_565478 [Mycena haematopus]
MPVQPYRFTEQITLRLVRVISLSSATPLAAFLPARDGNADLNRLVPRSVEPSPLAVNSYFVRQRRMKLHRLLTSCENKYQVRHLRRPLGIELASASIYSLLPIQARGYRRSSPEDPLRVAVTCSSPVQFVFGLRGCEQWLEADARRTWWVA